MDQALLVRDRLGAGRDLIDALRGSAFVVEDAYWLYDEEAEAWYLFLVSPFVEEHGPREAYRAVQAAMASLPEGSDLSLMEVKVIEPHDPIAAAVAEHLETYRPGRVTRIDRAPMGSRYVRDMYVYPRTFVRDFRP